MNIYLLQQAWKDKHTLFSMGFEKETMIPKSHNVQATKAKEVCLSEILHKHLEVGGLPSCCQARIGFTLNAPMHISLGLMN